MDEGEMRGWAESSDSGGVKGVNERVVDCRETGGWWRERRQGGQGPAGVSEG